MGNFVFCDRRIGRAFMSTALLVIFVAGCNSVRISEPTYTGSTANQRAIISGQPTPNAPINLGPVQAQPLPPAAAQPTQTQVSASAPAPYTPPKPYAASGMSAPVGRLPDQPATPTQVANQQPANTLNQQAATIAKRPAKPNMANNGRYVVQSGDTLWGIAHRHGVKPDDLVAANGLSGNKIKIGQSLNIPGGPVANTAVAAAKSKPAATKTAAVPKPKGAAPEPTRIAAVQPTRKDAPVKYTAPSADKTQSTASKADGPKAGTNGGFRWPVRGRIISGYGKKPNGERNDGINLAVPEGTSVKAAEDGVVIYAGNELKSYGNLVLVKHDNGFVTAYGHNSELLVKRGDTVRRGQIVAESGMSGGVTTPQLHFELRKGANPVNPLDYMSDA